jgi:hypothetical protein
MEDRCICCGEIIPEGMMACPNCMVASEKPMPKHPCQGCIYYKVCGESTRTAPCHGRVTKRERRKEGG